MSVPAEWLTSTPLRSERLELEPLRIDHAAEMAPLLDDPQLHTFIGGEPPTADDLRAQYARQVVGRSADGTERWLNWIVRRHEDGQVVGYVQATATMDDGRAVADVAWVIGSRFQRRGYAIQAAHLMVDWLRAQDVRTITAHVHPNHEASRSVAAHLGLHPTTVVVDGETRWEG